MRINEEKGDEEREWKSGLVLGDYDDEEKSKVIVLVDDNEKTIQKKVK